MECIICYDDVKYIPILTFCDNTTKNSNICINCIQRSLNNVLDNYITYIANETCEAAIKRISSQHLHTYLTEDCTGIGKHIKYITYNNEIINGKLKTKYSIQVIESLNKSLDLIHKYAVEDNSLFLLIKNEVFDKYK